MKGKVKRITPKTFTKMVSGGRSQIPGKIGRALRAAGMNGLAAKKSGSISQREALKALKHLEESGALGKYADSKEIFTPTPNNRPPLKLVPSKQSNRNMSALPWQ